MSNRSVGADVVNRILDAARFIERNLDRAICVAEMAETACYSLFHFTRLFNTISRLSPFEYLMRRRIGSTVDEVLSDRRSITEIAFASGFESVEGFSRSFRRMFGLLPSEARAGGLVDRRLILAPLDERRVGILGACRLAGTVVQSEEIDLSVSVFGAGEMIRAAEKLDLDQSPGGLWLGFVYDAPYDLDSVQTFLGSVPPSAAPFRFTIPAGEYRCIDISGPLDELPLLLELVFSTFVPRLRNPTPPDRIYLAPKAGGARLLFPMPSFGFKIPVR